MTNAEQTALDARHAKAQPVVIRAMLAERQGRYADAAPLFDEVAAIYAPNGSVYGEMADRCRAFARGESYPAKGRKRARGK